MPTILAVKDRIDTNRVEASASHFKTQQMKEADVIENQVIPTIYLFLSCLDFPSLAGFRCKLIYIQNR